MKWSRNTFTFMVIPDANSQTVRFRLPGVVLLLALAAALLLVAVALTAIVLYRQHADAGIRLKEQLAAAEGLYERTVDSKDKQIGELQADIADLSSQAKSIQDQMAGILELESEMKSMVGLGDAADRDGDEGEYAMDGAGGAGGTGGADLPVSDAAMESFIADTRADFSEIGERLDKLGPRLEQSMAEVTQVLQRLQVTPTIWPVDSRDITSAFGIRRDPFTHRATNHAGIDIGGSTGDPVYATADGVVVTAGKDASHGNHILISHGNGVQTHYSHLSRFEAAVGDNVKKGQIIGRMGSTGRSTGPHLHYEVLINGTHVNPRPYLKEIRKEQ